MGKFRKTISVLACTIFVLAMAIPANAEARIEVECGQVKKSSMENVMKRAPGTTMCGSEKCNLTATFSRYGKITGYGNVTTSKHDEYVEAFYYCSKGHTTVKDVNIGSQSHSLTRCDDLGHTGPYSDVHQYWRKCDCGHGENVYVDCTYRVSGVHTRP